MMIEVAWKIQIACRHIPQTSFHISKRATFTRKKVLLSWPLRSWLDSSCHGHLQKMKYFNEQVSNGLATFQAYFLVKTKSKQRMLHKKQASVSVLFLILLTDHESWALAWWKNIFFCQSHHLGSWLANCKGGQCLQPVHLWESISRPLYEPKDLNNTLTDL